MSDDALTIGEVINLLKDDFPDVSVSKVRFLESQGLLSPDRSDSGYRLFGEEDVARLRFVLQQQRDHFLPLKVIKSRLTLWERGEEVEGMEAPSGKPDLLDVQGEELERDDLLRRSGLEPGELSDLEEHGIVSSDDEGWYQPIDLRIAREAKRLLDMGFEARHLRTVRRAAEQEAALVERQWAGLLRMQNPDARRRVHDTVAACAEAMQAMHRAIVVSELRDVLETH